MIEDKKKSIKHIIVREGLVLLVVLSFWVIVLQIMKSTIAVDWIRHIENFDPIRQSVNPEDIWKDAVSILILLAYFIYLLIRFIIWALRILKLLIRKF